MSRRSWTSPPRCSTASFWIPPATMNSIVAAAIGRATQVIAVTSADVTSLKNTDLLLHYLEAQRKPRHRVLVALTETVAGSTADKARVEEALQTPVDWQIPYDRATAVGCQTGSPVVLSHPRSRASQNYLELAAGLTGRPIAGAPGAPAPLASIHPPRAGGCYSAAAQPRLGSRLARGSCANPGRWPGCAAPDVIVTTSIVECEIPLEARGGVGYGLDAVTQLVSGKTLAELPAADRKRLGQRGKAVRSIIPKFS